MTRKGVIPRQNWSNKTLLDFLLSYQKCTDVDFWRNKTNYENKIFVWKEYVWYMTHVFLYWWKWIEKKKTSFKSIWVLMMMGTLTEKILFWTLVWATLIFEMHLLVIALKRSTTKTAHTHTHTHTHTHKRNRSCSCVAQNSSKTTKLVLYMISNWKVVRF